MSIPTSFNPLGTLGAVELLDSVHVSCSEDEPQENLIQTAFGEDYYLEPFGSQGYFAEVEVENVSGMSVGNNGNVVSVGTYVQENIGQLRFYCDGKGSSRQGSYDIGTVTGNNGWVWLVNPSTDGRINNFNLHHKIENGIYTGEAANKRNTTNLGTWTAAKNVSQKITIYKIPGVSYDFKKLVAHTENVKFDALPARKGTKDGIAIFINDKLEKFIVV